MKTFVDSIACAAIRQPSSSRCGARSMISRSLNVPGSRSSASARTISLTPTELPHDRGNVFGPHRLVVAMVDGDDDRPAAASRALDRAQGHRPVLGGLAG